MPIVKHSQVPTFDIPGISHRTVAGKAQAMKTMEVWLQRIAPGAASPVHRHACEEVIVILKGSGRVMIDGETADFGPDSTLIVPSDAVHQIVNRGADEMQLVAALGMAPVRVRTPDGAPLPVPWEAP